MTLWAGGVKVIAKTDSMFIRSEAQGGEGQGVWVGTKHRRGVHTGLSPSTPHWGQADLQEPKLTVKLGAQGF